MRCASFGASPAGGAFFATAGQDGALRWWDTERLASSSSSSAATATSAELWRVPGAHAGVVHALDGVGGALRGHGPPEFLSGGEDGCARLWDPRVAAASGPVAAFEPPPAAAAAVPPGGCAPAPSGVGGGGGPRPQPARPPACWAVALGGAADRERRVAAAGWSTGDVRAWDLRAPSAGPLLAARLPGGRGVTSLEFDRRTIEKNRLVATGLDGALRSFDLRTLHPTDGAAVAGVTNAAPGAACTLWCVRHTPQDRETAAVCGGAGRVWLYRHRYPAAGRAEPHPGDGLPRGVGGELAQVGWHDVSTQPVVCWDWSPDRHGLAVCGALDQHVRVFAVTRLDGVQ